MKKNSKETNRKVLVILSNRFNRLQAAQYVELICQADGSILKQKKLRAAPAKPVYDEVWQNDEGKASLDDCNRMKRHYRHAFEKPAA